MFYVQAFRFFALSAYKVKQVVYRLHGRYHPLFVYCAGSKYLLYLPFSFSRKGSVSIQKKDV